MRLTPRAALASALFFAAGVPCGADETLPVPLDAATLQAKIDAAGGTMPGTYREVIGIDSPSGSSRFTLYHRGNDERRVYGFGSIHYETGENGGDDWHRNENGQVVYDAPDPDPGEGETFKTTVTPIAAPIRGYLLARLNARGFGTKTYVDTAFLVQRVERIRAHSVTTTINDERKTFGTATVVTKWHVQSSLQDKPVSYAVESFTIGDVTDADVAIPKSGPPLVRFPSGVTTVELPSEFDEDGTVYVKVKVGEKLCDFVLDSGAGTIAISPRILKEAGIKAFGEYVSDVNAQPYRGASAMVPNLAIGPLTMHDVVVSSAPFEVISGRGDVRAVGLLGFDFIAEVGLTIDYANRRVTAQAYGSYDPPSGKNVYALPIRLDAQQPMITATINGARADRMIVDTGAGGTFFLFDYFARRHPQALRDMFSVGSNDDPLFFMGVGGSFRTTEYKIQTISIGPVRFDRYQGFVVDKSSYDVNEDGLIGRAFLNYFTVMFDYPGGMMYLTPDMRGHRDMFGRKD
jgi:predicted aspartyl protease